MFASCLKCKFLFFVLLLSMFKSHFSIGQLDSIHWIPPLTSSDFGSSVGAYQHSIYLSTPQTTSFNVTITTGTGTLIGTYAISNSSPYRLDLADGSNYLCLGADSVGSVQRNDGLILQADKQFYANYRVRSNAQGGSLTAKGRIARGTDFYWGGVPNSGSSSSMNGVMGIMAIEDNTVVTIDGYDPGCEFRLGSVNNGITANSITVNLDAGETYVLECVNTITAVNNVGWVGAHVTSTKDIVMNNGNLMGGVVSGNMRDICIDQTLPTERLGTEHITLMGNGTIETELVVVVAISDGTTISINGAAPITTINEGDYYIINGANYSLEGNMYIETGLPCYVYQVLAGSSNVRTIGLNFIPPLSCLFPMSVDLISDIEAIRTTSYSGAATILTRAGATVTINGSPPTSSPSVVSGNSNWVTYLEAGLTGNATIVSDEPMAAGMFGASGDAGYAGYFSGFSDRPNLEILADPECAPTTLTLINTVDNIQWFRNDTLLVNDTLQTYFAAVEADYMVVAGTATCRDSSDVLTIDCNSLAVDLASFKAECSDDRLVLRWATIAEINNAYFTLWGSDNGLQFEELIHVEGSGNSFTSNNYFFEPSKSQQFPYYQLSQTDYDGMTEFFDIIASPKCFEEAVVFWINNGFLTSTNDMDDFELYDQMGRLLGTQRNGKLNVQTLSPGAYTVFYSTSDNERNFTRIFIQ